jgi:hypothetical protein
MTIDKRKIKRALEKARAMKHAVTSGRDNKGVVVYTCMKCLCHLIIPAEGAAFGVVIEYPCDVKDE